MGLSVDWLITGEGQLEAVELCSGFSLIPYYTQPAGVRPFFSLFLCFPAAV